MKPLLIAFLMFTTSPVWATEAIDITDPVRVSDLILLEKDLDSVSTAVMGCIDSGAKHSDCLCMNNEMITRFNKSVDKLFRNHPDLSANDLVSFRLPDGTSITLSLDSIRRQAATEPSCN